MSSQRHHYGVQLLDDLHYYFPALLYEPDAFGDFRDVLFYVRRQMQREMDLFSLAQRTYVSVDRSDFPSTRNRVVPSRSPLVASPLLSTPARRPAGAAAVPPPAPPRPSLRSQLNSIWQFEEPQENLNGLSALVSLMMNPTMLDPLPTLPVTATMPSNFMEPVPVIPTAEQVAAGTVIEIVDAEDDICAICQDPMEPGSNACSLNACDHRFHPGCITTWFQRDVHCPVCRHDIREPADDAESTSTEAT